jgi:hypothetical protein
MGDWKNPCLVLKNLGLLAQGKEAFGTVHEAISRFTESDSPISYRKYLLRQLARPC